MDCNRILLVAEFSSNHGQGAVSMTGRAINKIKLKYEHLVTRPL